MFTATLAAAQQVSQPAGTNTGPVNFSVGGAVDRSVNASVGQGGSNPGGGKSAKTAAVQAPSVVFATTRSGGVTLFVPHAFSGEREPGAQDESAPEEAASSPAGTKPDESKPATLKKGVRPGGGMAGANSFGPPPADSQAVFGFTGKFRGASSGWRKKRTSAEDAKLAKQLTAVPMSAGGGGKHHARTGALKAPPPKEPRGDEACEGASTLQLCTWGTP